MSSQPLLKSSLIAMAVAGLSAHVLNERWTLDADTAVDTELLRTALARFGLELAADPGTIVFLEDCDMPGGKGLHVVFKSEGLGRLSLLLPPANTRATAGTTARDGLRALVLKQAGQMMGVVAMDGTSPSLLEAWLARHLVPKNTG